MSLLVAMLVNNKLTKNITLSIQSKPKENPFMEIYRGQRCTAYLLLIDNNTPRTPHAVYKNKKP